MAQLKSPTHLEDRIEDLLRSIEETAGRCAQSIRDVASITSIAPQWLAHRQVILAANAWRLRQLRSLVDTATRHLEQLREEGS